MNHPLYDTLLKELETMLGIGLDLAPEERLHFEFDGDIGMSVVPIEGDDLIRLDAEIGPPGLLNPEIPGDLIRFLLLENCLEDAENRPLTGLTPRQTLRLSMYASLSRISGSRLADMMDTMMQAAVEMKSLIADMSSPQSKTTTSAVPDAEATGGLSMLKV